ncbi:cobalamin B12-binding domain-containing protein [Chloroflexota bacterium]
MDHLPIRVLMAKPGLDGHETGAKLIARVLRDAGMDVIYTGSRQTPEMIVRTASQEDIDIIGLSILSGAHKELCSRILTLLRQEGMEDIPLIVGGIIPDKDASVLKEMGVSEVFGPGTNTSQVVECVRNLMCSREKH